MTLKLCPRIVSKVATLLALLLHIPASASIPLLIQDVVLIPPAGEIIPTPTFFVFVRSRAALLKAQRLSYGQLYLSPQLTHSASSQPQAVPLRIAKRYYVDSRGHLFLELKAAAPLTPGISYELKAKPGAAEFIDMGKAKQTGQLWTVVPASEAIEPSWEEHSPTFNRFLIHVTSPPLSDTGIYAHFQHNQHDVAGFISLARDESGNITGSDQPGLSWPSSISPLVHRARCLTADLRWTELHSFEIIPLGRKGERGPSLHLPARVNRVFSSVLASFTRLQPLSYCPDGF